MKDSQNDPVKFRIDEDAELYKWHIPDINRSQDNYTIYFDPGVNITFDDTSGAGFDFEVNHADTRFTWYINGTNDNWITFTSAGGIHPTNHWVCCCGFWK